MLLKELVLRSNEFTTLPVSPLSGCTALTHLCLSCQRTGFQVSSPLLPVLHPGLVLLGLGGQVEKWDDMSLFHFGRAMVEVADRLPMLTLEM